jgi:hypothetical protein
MPYSHPLSLKIRRTQEEIEEKELLQDGGRWRESVIK